MKKFTAKLLILLLYIFPQNLPAIDKDPSAEQIIKNVQKKLEDVQVIEADFLQTFYWSLAEEEEQNSGKIYIGKKGCISNRNFSPTDCFGWEIGLDFINTRKAGCYRLFGSDGR